MLYILLFLLITPNFTQENVVTITNYIPRNIVSSDNIVTITNYIETNIVSSNIVITNTVVENIYIDQPNVITNRLSTNIYQTNYNDPIYSSKTNSQINYGAIEDFFRSVENGNYDKVSDYLKQGMDPNIRRLPDPNNGITALMCSIANRRISITKLLVAYGADVNLTATKRNIQNISPLMIATQQGPLEIVELLLQNNAQVNTQTKGASIGNTALITAVQYGNNKIVNALLSYGANPNIITAKGISVLMVAAQVGDVDTVNQLLSTPNLNIHAVDFEGKNALVYAYISGHIQLISILQKIGLSTNIPPDTLKKLTFKSLIQRYL